MTTKFTPKQLDDYAEYELVRQMGLWNMFSPQARNAAGLTKEEYMFVLKNYAELAAAYAEQSHE